MGNNPMEELFLVEPQEGYKEAFVKMVEEYGAVGEEYYFEMYKKALSDFKGYIQKLIEDRQGCEGWVPTNTFWLTNTSGEIAGVVRIRMSLEHDYVKKYAGHIGYDIAPLSRKKGYGFTLLKLALEKAKRLQFDKVLLTCDDDNVASRRIIEKNKGIFESTIMLNEKNKVLRRYWITLSD
ncbi:GNAT family N-acetyltransferase [Gorillibacterium timonense]|uniref:GNAT family N-acetyltransferase n=1 Tax=Gorillibacterium timonense TaxID=1689269 RepID=UPI00071C4B46|nr:GNAT family N-acetyltransferase [Gorillibacterium timonense]